MEATNVKRRKFHSKSRRGCYACKARRIKCDEHGPPCANCVVRKTDCAYPLPKGVKAQSNQHLAPASDVSSGMASSSASSLDVLGETTATGSPIFLASSSSTGTSARSRTISSHDSPSLALPASPSPSPAAFSSSESRNIMLELELMHQWSTRTWTAVHFIPGEQPFLQVDLPRLALRHSFLMDGLMATAAVDLAIAARPHDPAASTAYLCAAIEHSNRASAAFRVQLRDVNRDNLYILYYFATLAAHFNFVTPGMPVTPLQQADMFFTMMWGAVTISLVNLQWLIESPTKLADTFEHAANVRMELLDLLDPDTAAALGRMSAVLRTARLPPRDDVQGILAIESHPYCMAVGLVKYAFAEGDDGCRRGTFLSAIIGAGPEFLEATRSREHVALFVMLYWSVLIHRTGIIDPTKAWWIGSKGAELIDEITGILLTSWMGRRSEVREGIAWTRAQVGLPPISGCTWGGPVTT